MRCVRTTCKAALATGAVDVRDRRWERGMLLGVWPIVLDIIGAILGGMMGLFRKMICGVKLMCTTTEYLFPYIS